MRPSTIIIAAIAIGVCAAGAWLLFTPGEALTTQGSASRAGDLPKAPQDYPTSGGQQMKPRW